MMERAPSSRHAAAFGLSCLCLLWCLWPALAPAASLSVSWDPNGEPDLAGYRIYYGTAPGAYDLFVPVKADATGCQLGDLVPETAYYVVVTAYDLSGNESDFSEERSVTTECDTPLVLYRDLDGDGYGWKLESIVACSPVPGYVLNCTDCDDNNRAVHPGAVEVRDGLDNNCNGLIDDLPAPLVRRR